MSYLTSNRTSTADYRKIKLELDKEKERVQALEKALQTAHAKVADSIHPLLSRTEAQASSSASPSSSIDNIPPADQDQDISEVFGTLSIADSGESVFLGPSAVSEVSVVLQSSKC